jgi:hypothetical protein
MRFLLVCDSKTKKDAVDIKPCTDHALVVVRFLVVVSRF